MDSRGCVGTLADNSVFIGRNLFYGPLQRISVYRLFQMVERDGRKPDEGLG